MTRRSQSSSTVRAVLPSLLGVLLTPATQVFEKASLHTVEDLQAFGNSACASVEALEVVLSYAGADFMPSPFWVREIGRAHV